MKNSLFFLLLAMLFCRCKDQVIDPCENIYCNGGSVCNPNTNKCECPEGTFFVDVLCVNKEPGMYFPVAQNAECFCFYEISAIWVAENLNSLQFHIYSPQDGRSHSYNIDGFQLNANSDTTSQWTYLDRFVSGYWPLTCKLGETFVDAHAYINISEDTIRIKTDFVPFIADDWLHQQEYPVLETCELVFVK